MTDETAIATAATHWAVERLGDSAYAARCLSFLQGHPPRRWGDA